ncbi:hypothetical protein [Arthrobacter sp. efr-133-TYG-104]|uniref:hypothetical protein n=1 Tax=Arthrobacter sp. efr-133-TYG-104 TaxID=3040324 RepID=UPI00254B4965|nr:hypothetical protein [Arthrobacter sp. efr-133-TYG-104]
MSNPPLPPTNPGDTNHPQPPGAPQYGQASPPPAPQYGQVSPPPAPQYGQASPPPAAPQYGQASPPPAPQYGQASPPPAPQYGQVSQPTAPMYNQPMSWPSEAAASATGVPQLVNVSFWMLLGCALLTLISLPLTIVMLNSSAGQSMVEQAIQAQGTQDPAVTVSNLINLAITFLVIISIIMIGLYTLVAFKIRRGKNWARILGTVLAALSLLGLAQLGLTTITILLGIAAIVLLYLPSSAPYFRKAKPFSGAFQNPYGN